MRIIDAQGKLLGRINWMDAAAVLFGLFSVGLIAHFAYQNFFRHTTLTLEKTDPEVFVPGIHPWVSVYGNGFNEHIHVEVSGQLPHRVLWVNEARVDLQLPDDLEPGRHILTFRDFRGRMGTRSDLLQIAWQPVVDRIVLEEPQITRYSYRIFGKYLQKGCSIRVGDTLASTMDYVNSKEILITVPTVSPNSPWTKLVIQNPCGNSVTLEGDELLRRLAPEKSSSLPQPSIARIVPRLIPSDRETGIVVLGLDLMEGCTVRIGQQPLESLEWHQPHMVLGVLPANALVPGTYAIEVTNPNGKSDKTESSIDIVAKKMLDVELRFQELSREELRAIVGPSWRTPFLRVLQVFGKGKAGDGVHAKVRLPVEVKGSENGYPIYYCYGKYRLEPGLQFPLRLSKDRKTPVVLRAVSPHPKKWLTFKQKAL